MRKIALTALMLLLSASALAQPVPGLSSAQPITISAAKSLEWDRKAHVYTAKQDVIVTQGAVSIHCDSLAARYTDDSGATDIKTLEANGHVTISSPPYTAYGDKAVYTVATGTATMTGHDLHITSDEDLLTATDRIEFSAKDNKMTAVGHATATHGEDVLNADALSVYFAKDANGKMTAKKIAAESNVVIKTARETATGDAGVYDVGSQKAVLTGKVRAGTGPNQIEGTRADVDMNTGISRLSGDGNAESGGRVTGTFYPKSGNTKQ